MTTDLAIVGIGGHGRECLDIAEAMVAAGADMRVVGFFDDAPSEPHISLIAMRGYELLGNVDDMFRRHDYSVCVGVGLSSARAAVAARLTREGVESPVLVHPDTSIGSHVTLEGGAVVFAGARLTTNVRLGRHAHVGQNATVGHDSSLGECSTLYPQAAISGNVAVGSRATVGAAAVVLQNLVIGEDAFVGAAACVVADVPNSRTVKGVPAR